MFVSSVAVCCFVLAVVVVVVSHILVTIAVRHPPLLGATFFGGFIYTRAIFSQSLFFMFNSDLQRLLEEAPQS